MLLKVEFFSPQRLGFTALYKKLLFADNCRQKVGPSPTFKQITGFTPSL